jgi:2,3-bisphosphoglycerate-independent phosphoglycerate mutase
VALVILDGWGISRTATGNAIAAARTPYYDEICARFPMTALAAAGDAVGLTPGDAGNAEAGHMCIGTGRAVKTEAVRIAEAIRDGSFEENPALCDALAKAKNEGRSVHLVGLLSDAGIHAVPEAVYALLRMAKRAGVEDVYVHGILDGRDVLPRTADVYIDALEVKMAEIGVGSIATVCGRFFGMDPSENWERTARAFTLMVYGEGERARDAASAVRNSFLRGISDEFVAPIVVENALGQPVAKIGDGDTVIFFNHRADTMRQLARSLAVPDVGAATAKPKINVVCMSEYDRSFGLHAAFKPNASVNVLGEVLNDAHVPSFRITETDRFPHVTTFFNGGAAACGPYEQHVQVASTAAAFREHEPEMGSFKIADRFMRTVEVNGSGLYVLNIPAPDIVAETCGFDRTVESIQFVDTCLGGVIEKVRSVGGVAMITSSHGNCEAMQGKNGELDRSATKNPVPVHLVGDAETVDLRSEGSLSDVAPTILGLLGLPKPAEMTGIDLRRV